MDIVRTQQQVTDIEEEKIQDLMNEIMSPKTTSRSIRSLLERGGSALPCVVWTSVMISSILNSRGCKADLSFEDEWDHG